MTSPDGRNARETIADHESLPLAKLRRGETWTSRLWMTMGGPQPPWTVTVGWTDESGPRVDGPMVVTTD